MIRYRSVLVSLFLGVVLGSNALADGRQEIQFPDVPGYRTLKCDFHMHTVFSDGTVWPTVRVEEAWREGLDAFAITDHIDYRPHTTITYEATGEVRIALNPGAIRDLRG